LEPWSWRRWHLEMLVNNRSKFSFSVINFSDAALNPLKTSVVRVKRFFCGIDLLIAFNQVHIWSTCVWSMTWRVLRYLLLKTANITPEAVDLCFQWDKVFVNYPLINLASISHVMNSFNKIKTMSNICFVNLLFESWELLKKLFLLDSYLSKLVLLIPIRFYDETKVRLSILWAFDGISDNLVVLLHLICHLSEFLLALFNALNPLWVHSVNCHVDSVYV